MLVKNALGKAITLATLAAAIPLNQLCPFPLDDTSKQGGGFTWRFEKIGRKDRIILEIDRTMWTAGASFDRSLTLGQPEAPATGPNANIGGPVDVCVGTTPGGNDLMDWHRKLGISGSLTAFGVGPKKRPASIDLAAHEKVYITIEFNADAFDNDPKHGTANNVNGFLQ